MLQEVLGSWPPITALGPAGLVGLGIYMVFTGRLVPKKEVDKLERDRDYYRDAERINAQHLAELKAQVGKQTEYSLFIADFIASMPHPLYPPDHPARSRFRQRIGLDVEDVSK